MQIPNALFIFDPEFFDVVYGKKERDELRTIARFPDRCFSPDEIASCPDLLAEADFIYSGWGAPQLNDKFLCAMPRLKSFFYGAGSIKSVVTEAFWDRNIPITSAYAANAIPVAEFTLAQIILSLKNVWRYVPEMRKLRTYPADRQAPGTYGRTVAIISLGLIGRLLRKKLRAFDFKVIAYDPYIDPSTAAELDVEMVSLEEAFASADIVSLHTPLLDETAGMISGKLISSMKHGATLINTARGKIVNEPEMIEVLTKRPDLVAVLDVTEEEPPLEDSPLYSLPNVVLTPHIAGSTGADCQRMGRYMIDETHRFLKGQNMQWQITREIASTLA